MEAKNCPVCSIQFEAVMQVTVRGRHQTQMGRCPACGFISYPEIWWLEEAYEKPINPSDVGYVHRNVYFAGILARLLHEKEFCQKFYLDYGSGYGMFVRLMRDRGYHFHSLDPYCKSLFASHTPACRKRFGKYQLVTAFEVFEHLADPIASVGRIFEFSEAVIFTTDLVPEPVPPAADWDYYGFEHGQHIALWTVKSLELLAARFGRSYSNLSWISPSWHLIAPPSNRLHTPWLKQDPRWLRMLKRLIKPQEKRDFPPSLMMHDYHRVVSLEKHASEIESGDFFAHLDWDCAINSLKR